MFWTGTYFKSKRGAITNYAKVAGIFQDYSRETKTHGHYAQKIVLKNHFHIRYPTQSFG